MSVCEAMTVCDSPGCLRGGGHQGHLEYILFMKSSRLSVSRMVFFLIKYFYI